MPLAQHHPAVRPAEEHDAPQIARLATEALAAKYRPALGRSAVPAVEALVRRDLRERRGTRRWVAEVDGRVAGTVTLALAREVDAGFPAALAEAVGWTRATWATLVLGILGHGRLDADEAYLDELAVASWARRRGAARALVETCAAHAHEEGRRRLTLWVTIDNAGARALYDEAGFRERRRRRWIAGRLIFGSPGAILMERPLGPPAR